MKTLTKLNEILKDIKKRFGKKLNGIQKDKIYTRNELREQFKKYSNDKYHVQDFLKKPFDLPLRFLNEIHPYIKNTFTSASYDQTKHKVIIEGKSFKYGFKINDLSNFCLPFMRLLALHYKAFTKEDLKDVPLTAKMIEDTFANEFEKKDEEKEDIKDEWYLDKIKIFKDNIKNIKFVFVKPNEHNDYRVIKIKRVENYRGLLMAHSYETNNGKSNKYKRGVIDLLTGVSFGYTNINENGYYRKNIDNNFNDVTLLIKKASIGYFTFLSENSIQEIIVDEDLNEEIIIKPNTPIYQNETEIKEYEEKEKKTKEEIKLQIEHYAEKKENKTKDDFKTWMKKRKLETKVKTKKTTIIKKEKTKPFKKIGNYKFENKMPFEILIIRRFLAVKTKEKIKELFSYMKKKALNKEILKANVGGDFMLSIQKTLQKAYNYNLNINKVINDFFNTKEINKMTQLADAYKSNPVVSIYRYYINQVEPNFSKESILNIKNKINLLNKRYNIKELPYSNLLKDIENNINHKKEIELLPLLAGVKSNKIDFKQNLNNNKVFNLFENIKTNNKTLKGTETHEKQEETHEKIETKNNHIFSAKDLINKEYTSANVGIFSDILGNVTEPFYVMISGESGGGKSSFCMQLAKYFSDIKKKVLYITSEEGMSSTLKEKLKRFKITSETIDFTDNLESAKPILQNYNYVFFDSVNHMNINVADFKSLIKKGKEKNISMVFIFQYTKDGKFKGETEYAHEVDQTLVANQGVVSIYGSKNRFNGKGNFKVY